MVPISCRTGGTDGSVFARKYVCRGRGDRVVSYNFRTYIIRLYTVQYAMLFRCCHSRRKGFYIAVPLMLCSVVVRCWKNFCPSYLAVISEWNGVLLYVILRIKHFRGLFNPSISCIYMQPSIIMILISKNSDGKVFLSTFTLGQNVC